MRLDLPNLHAEFDGGKTLRFWAGHEAYLININDPPRAKKILHPGAHNWRRRVEHYAPPDPERPELILRAGYTVHQGDGTWSSLPHDFEEGPKEPGFEEIFFYRLDPARGRAIQVRRGMLHDGASVDDLVPIHDSTFCAIPFGHHPVVGEPNVHVSYFWAYLAKKPEWEKI